MRTLLPILKTKLFVLSFVSACTVILATTVPQIRNFIVAEKVIGEKITTEQKKISPNIKKQNKTVSGSRLTSGLSLEMNKSVEATVVSDKPDYAPRSTATFTGAGFAANEEVILKVKNLSYPCNTVFADSSYLPWTATADENGDFVTSWTVCDCPGDSLRLKATGQLSGSIAYAYFTDAALFTATINPTDACVGQTSSFTVTVTNANTSPTTTKIGGIKILIPSGVTISGTPTVLAYDAPGVLSPQTWAYDAINSSSTVLSFNATGTPSQTIDNTGRAEISFNALISTSTTKIFTTSAFQNVNYTGTAFSISGLQPSVTVDVTPPVIGALPAPSTIECPATPNFTPATATDNSGATPSLTFADANTPGTCANEYTVTRTWTARDACGNTSTADQAITVEDDTAPAISGVGADGTVECPATPEFSIPTASDACGQHTLTHSDATTPGSCSNEYTVTRTWTARDACGNISTADQSITVEDNTAPVISGVGADGTIECPATPEFSNPTASDACGAYTLTHDDATTPSSCANEYTVTRTWTARDACGNISTADQAITVEDNTAPVISGVGADGTIECPATPEFSNPTASDACGAYTLTHDDATTPSSCANEYTVTRTWTARDACGNISTADQAITVEDNTAPVISGVGTDGTIECPSPVVFSIPTASDACGAYTLTHDDATTPSSCANEYTVTRTWTARDACGNISTADQAITVEDNTPPVISGVDITQIVIFCPATPEFSTATATDACGANTLIFFDIRTPGTCDNEYRVTRTWTATDACNNTSTASQTITVEDDTAPAISSIPANTTVSCAGEVPAANDAAVTASDNCGGSVTISHNADVITPGSCANRYSIARTYIATDVCGNSSSQTQTILVNDQTAPVINSIPANATVSCVSEVPAANNAGVSASDNCGGSVTISHNADVLTPGSCANRYSIARTYIATDVCSNSSSQTQTITVNDQIAPVINSIPANATVSCVSEVPGASDASVSASDNCGGSVTISHNADVITPGSCANRYSIARTYIATDVCGNSSSQTQTILVNDQTAPVINSIPANATVSCGNEVPAANNAGVSASDNCGGAVTISHNADVITPGSCANRYSIARTYIATDVCGNSSSQTQTILVNDQTAPVINSIPANATVSCVSEVPAANNAGVSASDNCGGAVTISHNADVITPGSCANRYSIARTYIATDVCGNSSSQTQTILVNDQTAPVINSIPANATVSCVSEVPAANNAGVSASDNCGGAVTISHNADVITPGSCTNRYSIARTYIATDVCGNSSSQTQTILVNDQTAPVINSIPANATVSCGNEVPAANNAGVSASDNCGGAVTISHNADVITPGSCANRYSIARTYIATDVCGNSSTQTQTILVNDQTAPVISGVGADGTIECPAIPNFSVPTASDACGPLTLTSSDATTPGSCANEYTVTRTWTARDACGNISTADQAITVEDNTLPVFTSTSLSLDKKCLWPPNHKMVDIAITPTASDACGSIAASILVTSNEPANDIGDGNTEEDIAWASGSVQSSDPYTVQGPITLGTDGKYHIQLRAERSGVNTETGRIYTIYFTATDACGNTATASNQVTVAHNITSPGPGNAYPINTTINFAGTFWDVAGKTHTAKWVVDGTTVNGTVTAEPSGNKMGKVTGSFKPTVAGVYKLRMNVTDQSGVTGYATTSGDYEAYFVAYDPKGGFTYGGGQFISPAGALPARPNLTSVVTFGFASNYYKNATNPKGETQIDLKLTDGDYSFAFNALNYDYLVANGSSATYKGLGKTTINGVEQSGLAFILKVIDGKTATNSNGVDKIRMKIYNKNTGAVIYDNEMGVSETIDPSTPVDKPKDDGTDIVVVSNPATSTNITAEITQMETVTPDITRFNVKVFPNPTEHQFTLVLDGASNDKVQIVVYDAVGRQVKMFEKESANIPIRFGADLKTGAYIVEVRQGDSRKTLKLIKQ